LDAPALFARFDGKCWVCRKADATEIDHDHSCCPLGKRCEKCARGAVCHSCNVAIGNIETRPGRFDNRTRKVVLYLARFYARRPDALDRLDAWADNQLQPFGRRNG
jgi:Recombination endonuclease VII